MQHHSLRNTPGCTPPHCLELAVHGHLHPTAPSCPQTAPAQRTAHLELAVHGRRVHPQLVVVQDAARRAAPCVHEHVARPPPARLLRLLRACACAGGRWRAVRRPELPLGLPLLQLGGRHHHEQRSRRLELPPARSPRGDSTRQSFREHAERTAGTAGDGDGRGAGALTGRSGGRPRRWQSCPGPAGASMRCAPGQRRDHAASCGAHKVSSARTACTARTARARTGSSATMACLPTAHARRSALSACSWCG